MLLHSTATALVAAGVEVHPAVAGAVARTLVRPVEAGEGLHICHEEEAVAERNRHPAPMAAEAAEVAYMLLACQVVEEVMLQPQS
jgi:hypothetical protein